MYRPQHLAVTLLAAPGGIFPEQKPPALPCEGGLASPCAGSEDRLSIPLQIQRFHPNSGIRLGMQLLESLQTEVLRSQRDAEAFPRAGRFLWLRCSSPAELGSNVGMCLQRARRSKSCLWRQVSGASAAGRH